MKSLKKISILFATILLVFSLVACGSNKEVESNPNTKDIKTEENKKEEGNNQENTDGESQKIVDREGNEIVLPENAEKIISLAPSITETLVNLGLADKLIAVDKYSLEVEGVNKELPVFDIMSPDAENIVALKPDIIFGTGMSKANGTDPFAPMVEMGTFVTVIPTSTSVQGIFDDIIFIGKVTKTEEKANEIVENYKNEMKNITDKIATANLDKKPIVYFETSPFPNAYTFGKNVFLDDMLNMLGAENIFADQEGWMAVSEEQVINKNPNIIFTNADFTEVPAEINSREGWNAIDAIKNGQVYLIDKNSSSRANENSIIAFRQMAKYLYPDLFTE